jgi:hypothetical protein
VRHRPLFPMRVGESGGHLGQLDVICDATPKKRFFISWR